MTTQQIAPKSPKLTKWQTLRRDAEQGNHEYTPYDYMRELYKAVMVDGPHNADLSKMRRGSK